MLCAVPTRWVIFSGVTLPLVIADELHVRQDDCPAKCKWRAEAGTHYWWKSLEVNTTILAANVLVSINTDLSRTERFTEYLPLPDGYKIPDTNVLGTQISTLTFPDAEPSTEIVLAYPTELSSLPTVYTWSGTLFTSGQCSTALQGAIAPYTYSQFQLGMPATASPLTDSLGLFYRITARGGPYPIPSNDGATACDDQTGVAPFKVENTAIFITSEMTITGGEPYTPPPPASKQTMDPVSPRPTASTNSVPTSISNASTPTASATSSNGFKQALGCRKEVLSFVLAILGMSIY